MLQLSNSVTVQHHPVQMLDVAGTSDSEHLGNAHGVHMQCKVWHMIRM